MSETNSEYDFIVIGGGSGGISTARRAAQHGAKVALIEGQSRLGGTCVNVGCVPKKVMWNCSNIAQSIKDASGYGFDVDFNGFSWEAIKESRTNYVKKLNGIYERNLGRSEVAHIEGYGKFVGENTLEVNGKLYTAPHILVAVGGAPNDPGIPGQEFGINSDDFFDELDHLPPKVAVVGSGYIGVELSGVLNGLGSETHLLIRRESVLRSFDEIIGETVLQSLQNDGAIVHTNFTTSEVIKAEDGTLTLVNQDGSKVEGFDTVIWAIGRHPLTEQLDLGASGIETDSRGYIVVDEYQNTTCEGVYAVGDCTPAVQLTPVAINAGRKLAGRLFNGQEGLKTDYTNIPSVIFSHPPSGSVGLSERDAVEQFGADSVKSFTAGFTNMYHSVTEHKTRTEMKMVTVGDEEKVVGLHMIGIGVDEMLQGFAVAIKMGATRQDFNDTIPIHPTGAEEVVLL
eukprot:TRINITY_DN11532_c0_g1_i1.p1 TRINITY_DN11532_c0_g1~~TRINITY_DN11532_c0_g1_i1.p1  ORF type:complete len:455 (-),score=139.40 TRINITY_DN11532_c0_g1_i1:84-1448(-)